METILNIMEPVLTELVIINYIGDTLDDNNNNNDNNDDDGDDDDDDHNDSCDNSNHNNPSNVMAYGSYHGNGTATLDNGCSYTGEFQFGLFHGTGIFKWVDGTIYEGSFVHGQITGKGKYIWNDGNVYEGEVRNGKRHGKGILHNSAGQMYDGQWIEGRKDGQGKYWYDESGSYIYHGEWKEGERNGYGTMRYNNGNSYEGYWYQSKKHGRGIMTWRDIGEIYTGDWIEDIPHGQGEYIWGGYDTINQRPLWKQHCNIYRGSFFYGERDGYGTFFYANGSQYSGQWKSNKKHGEGTFYYNDGRIFYGLFTNDYIDKVNESLPINKGNQNLNPRETSDVNVQYHLNIHDILLQYVFYDFSVNDNSSMDVEVKECERILLRYHTYLRQHYRDICDRSNKLRMKHSSSYEYNLFDNMELAVMSEKIERVMYISRQYHPCRLYCATMDSIQLFFEDIGLIDTIIFTHDDFIGLVRNMKKSRYNVIRQKRYDYLSQMNSEYGMIPNQSNTISIHDLISHIYVKDVNIVNNNSSNSSNSSSIDNNVNYDDPRYPILEKDFIELLVRCIAMRNIHEYAYNTTVKYMPLSKALYKYLAEKVQPILSDSSFINPWIQAYHHESIQEYIHNNDIYSTLRNVWDTKRTISQMITIRDIFKTIESIIGLLPTKDYTKVLNINRSSDGKELDMFLDNTIGFTDMIFLFTKIAMSDLYTNSVNKDENENDDGIKTSSEQQTDRPLQEVMKDKLMTFISMFPSANGNIQTNELQR